MESIAKTVRLVALGIAMSLLAPLAFFGVFARRAAWKRLAAISKTSAQLVRDEKDRWSYNYTLSEFWSGEVRKHHNPR